MKAAIALAIAVAVFAATGAALRPVDAAAVPFPTLLGESFMATEFTLEQINCVADGTSTFSFTATGDASGPYPGTFEVRGTYTIGPGTSAGSLPSTDVQYHESFTIISGDTTVTGTKEVATGDTGPYLPGASGWCYRFGTIFGQVGTSAIARGLMSYHAVLSDSTGASQAAGLSGTTALADRYDPCCPGPNPDRSFFTEAFVTSSPEGPPLAPYTVVASPPDAVNLLDTQHVITATVEDITGRPVSNVTVRFTVDGSVTARGSCTTGSGGQCSFSYTGLAFPGVDSIVVCADMNANGIADADEPCASARKVWTLPATPGQATGGGQTASATFGFTAKSTDNHLTGECTVVDEATKTKIKCLDVMTFVQRGNHAMFFGDATVDGIAAIYRIDIDDYAEPGAGADRFTIQTTTGYSAGGALEAGNVQIHRG